MQIFRVFFKLAVSPNSSDMNELYEMLAVALKMFKILKVD